MSKELIEAVGKIEDEGLKTTLSSLITPLVKEHGKRGQDLIDLKEEVRALRANSPDASYSEMHKQLTAMKVDPKEIPKLLEKLKVSKTAEDELEILKSKNLEDSKARTALESELKAYKNKERLSKLLPEVKPTIVDAKGKPVTIIEEFIGRHTEGLAANLSEDPVVAKEQIKQSLTAALQEQEKMAAAFGYQGPHIPKIPNGANFNQPTGISPSDMQKIMQTQGPAAAFAARRQAGQPG
jgi:hypothetical protein